MSDPSSKAAIFAIEVLYRDEDFEAEALIPAFISCTIAYCVFALTASYVFGVLKGIAVGDVRKASGAPVMTFSQDTPLSTVQESIPVTTQTAFPVVDNEGNYLALFSLNQIRRILYEKEFGQFAIVADVAISSVEPFRLDTDLSSAVADFARLEYDELPVVDAEGKKILGLLRRQDLLTVYNARLAEMQCPSPQNRRPNSETATTEADPPTMTLTP